MKKIILISTITAVSLFAAAIKFNEADNSFKRVNPEFDTDVVLSYHSSINEAKKSIVNISTSKTVKDSYSMNGMFNDPFFKDFFGFNFGAPEDQARKTSSLGSGVIISDDGYIVTNNHVVEGADEIIVTLLDNNKEYKAKIIGADPKTDLAIIKIEDKNLKAIKIANSNELMEGDIVFAIGNPFGVGGSITQGIVSALNKNNIGLNQYENFIQTDASINPGNSGGALVDSRGALVGINSAILSRSGGNNGIGFAIPSNMVKDIATKLIVDGKIDRGFIGVTISDLTKDQEEIYKNKAGALITSAQKDLPADKAGIKRGDLIIKANGQDVKNATDLKNIVGSLPPGKNMDVEYERGGKVSKATVKLVDMDGGPNTQSSAAKTDIKGLSVSNLSEDIRRKYRIDNDVNGILITDIKADSDADKYGFKTADIIIQVGQKEIKNISEFNNAINDHKDKKTLVWVIRQGVPQGIVIK